MVFQILTFNRCVTNISSSLLHGVIFPWKLGSVFGLRLGKYVINIIFDAVLKPSRMAIIGAYRFLKSWKVLKAWKYALLIFAPYSSISPEAIRRNKLLGKIMKKIPKILLQISETKLIEARWGHRQWLVLWNNYHLNQV